MMKTIDVLNHFQIENLEFVILCNRPDNFNQIKLAAAELLASVSNLVAGL